MNLEMVRFLNDREQLPHHLAQESIVPAEAPPLAVYRFKLRRNKRTACGQIRRYVSGRETTGPLIQPLGIHHEASCRELRGRIKHLWTGCGCKRIDRKEMTSRDSY